MSVYFGSANSQTGPVQAKLKFGNLQAEATGENKPSDAELAQAYDGGSRYYLLNNVLGTRDGQGEHPRKNYDLLVAIKGLANNQQIPDSKEVDLSGLYKSENGGLRPGGEQAKIAAGLKTMDQLGGFITITESSQGQPSKAIITDLGRYALKIGDPHKTSRG